MFVVAALLFSLLSFRHPYHVNVIEIRENTKKAEWQMLVRVFTNEWEASLKSELDFALDLKNEADSGRVGLILENYVARHLKVTGNTKSLEWKWEGYETKQDETWCYLSASAPACDSLKVEADILYEHKHEQQTIVHWYIDENRVSRKFSAPEKQTLLKK